MKVENIVVTANLGRALDLKELAKLPNAKYEPENFPGLVLKIRGASALIFSSGALVITGTVTEQQADDVVLDIIKLIEGGKKK